MCFPAYLSVLGWAPGTHSDPGVFLQVGPWRVPVGSTDGRKRLEAGMSMQMSSRTMHLMHHASQQRHRFWNWVGLWQLSRVKEDVLAFVSSNWPLSGCRLSLERRQNLDWDNFLLNKAIPRAINRYKLWQANSPSSWRWGCIITEWQEKWCWWHTTAPTMCVWQNFSWGIIHVYSSKVGNSWQTKVRTSSKSNLVNQLVSTGIWVRGYL